MSDTRTWICWNGAQLALINTCNLPPFILCQPHTDKMLWDKNAKCSTRLVLAIAWNQGGENKYVFIPIENEREKERKSNVCVCYPDVGSLAKKCALPLFSLRTQNWCTFWNFYRLNVQMNTYLLVSLFQEPPRHSHIYRHQFRAEHFPSYLFAFFTSFIIFILFSSEYIYVCVCVSFFFLLDNSFPSLLLHLSSV